MADDKITGNNVVTSDFVRVLMALKENIMKDAHCLELAIVKEINDEKVNCQLVSDPSITVQAIRINNMSVVKNQIVLLGFNDNDFKYNLLQHYNNGSLKEIDAKSRHVLTNAIIVSNFSSIDGSDKANVNADNLTPLNIVAWKSKLEIPSAITSINGLSGGTLTSALRLTGGNPNNASIVLEDSGQLIDNSSSNYCVLGRYQGNFIVNAPIYPMRLRGSETRPKYNNDDMALLSDIPAYDTANVGNTLVMRDENGDINIGNLNLRASGNNESNIGNNGIRWGYNSLPALSNPEFVCSIDSFASGGRQKYTSVGDLRNVLNLGPSGVYSEITATGAYTPSSNGFIVARADSSTDGSVARIKVYNSTDNAYVEICSNLTPARTAIGYNDAQTMICPVCKGITYFLDRSTNYHFYFFSYA